MTNDNKTGKAAGEIKTIIRHVFLHNGWAKLLAIIISLCLWAGLISQDPKLTREKNFQSVTVTITGSDTMKRNGYIVTSDINEALSGVNAVAAVPQQYYDAAEATNYNPRVDLSKITSAGTQMIKITSSSNPSYGKLVSITPETIEITVEEYKTRSRIPVSVTVEGDAPKGWYMSAATADPALITVSGPQSVVNSVSRARVVLNADEIEWSEGISRTAASFTLYDKNGEPIDSSLLEVTTESVLIDSIIVEQNIYPEKNARVKTDGIVTGRPASGYAVTGIAAEPETVAAAGRQEVLDQFTDIMLNGTVDVTDASESVTAELRLKRPADVVHLNTDTVTVTVSVMPEETGEEQRDADTENEP